MPRMTLSTAIGLALFLSICPQVVQAGDDAKNDAPQKSQIQVAGDKRDSTQITAKDNVSTQDVLKQGSARLKAEAEVQDLAATNSGMFVDVDEAVRGLLVSRHFQVLYPKGAQNQARKESQDVSNHVWQDWYRSLSLKLFTAWKLSPKTPGQMTVELAVAPDGQLAATQYGAYYFAGSSSQPVVQTEAEDLFRSAIASAIADANARADATENTGVVRCWPGGLVAKDKGKDATAKDSTKSTRDAASASRDSDSDSASAHRTTGDTKKMFAFPVRTAAEAATFSVTFGYDSQEFPRHGAQGFGLFAQVDPKGDVHITPGGGDGHEGLALENVTCHQHSLIVSSSNGSIEVGNITVSGK